MDYPAAGPLGSYITGINEAGTIEGVYFDGAGIAHGYEATPAKGKSAAAKTTPAASVSPDFAILASSLIPGGAASAPSSAFPAASLPGAPVGSASALAIPPLTEQLLPPASVRLSGATHAAHSAAVDSLFADPDSMIGNF